MYEVKNAEELETLKRETPVLLIFFGGIDCNVCHAMKPHIIKLVESNYSQIKMIYVDCHVESEICAQYGVFTLPVVQIYFEGQRFIEKVRHFSMLELSSELDRPYSMMFENV